MEEALDICHHHWGWSAKDIAVLLYFSISTENFFLVKNKTLIIVIRKVMCTDKNSNCTPTVYDVIALPPCHKKDNVKSPA